MTNRRVNHKSQSVTGLNMELMLSVCEDLLQPDLSTVLRAELIAELSSETQRVGRDSNMSSAFTSIPAVSPFIFYMQLKPVL